LYKQNQIIFCIKVVPFCAEPVLYLAVLQSANQEAAPFSIGLSLETKMRSIKGFIFGLLFLALPELFLAAFVAPHGRRGVLSREFTSVKLSAKKSPGENERKPIILGPVKPVNRFSTSKPPPGPAKHVNRFSTPKPSPRSTPTAPTGNGSPPLPPWIGTYPNTPSSSNGSKQPAAPKRTHKPPPMPRREFDKKRMGAPRTSPSRPSSSSSSSPLSPINFSSYVMDSPLSESARNFSSYMRVSPISVSARNFSSYVRDHSPLSVSAGKPNDEKAKGTVESKAEEETAPKYQLNVADAVKAGALWISVPVALYFASTFTSDGNLPNASPVADGIMSLASGGTDDVMESASTDVPTERTDTSTEPASVSVPSAKTATVAESVAVAVPLENTNTVPESAPVSIPRARLSQLLGRFKTETVAKFVDFLSEKTNTVPESASFSVPRVQLSQFLDRFKPSVPSVPILQELNNKVKSTRDAAVTIPRNTYQNLVGQVQAVRANIKTLAESILVEPPEISYQNSLTNYIDRMSQPWTPPDLVTSSATPSLNWNQPATPPPTSPPSVDLSTPQNDVESASQAPEVVAQMDVAPISNDAVSSEPLVTKSVQIQDATASTSVKDDKAPNTYEEYMRQRMEAEELMSKNMQQEQMATPPQAEASPQVIADVPNLPVQESVDTTTAATATTSPSQGNSQAGQDDVVVAEVSTTKGATMEVPRTKLVQLLEVIQASAPSISIPQELSDKLESTHGAVVSIPLDAYANLQAQVKAVEENLKALEKVLQIEPKEIPNTNSMAGYADQMNQPWTASERASSTMKSSAEPFKPEVAAARSIPGVRRHHSVQYGTSDGQNLYRGISYYGNNYNTKPSNNADRQRTNLV
jgi:hypothetical protein